MVKEEEAVWDLEHGYEEKNLDFSSDDFEVVNPSSIDQCSTRKITKTQCRIEEVENGKFIKKCEKTEQILKDCVGKPTEVVKSTTEYTNEDVTDEKNRWFLPSTDSEFKTVQSDLKNFDFPGLRGDIETLEKHMFGGLRSFFEAAEDMVSGFDKVFGSLQHNDGDSSSSSSFRQNIPIESQVEKGTSGGQRNDKESVYSEFAGQIRDV